MISKIKNWYKNLFEGDLGKDAVNMKEQSIQEAQVKEVKKRKRKYYPKKVKK